MERLKTSMAAAAIATDLTAPILPATAQTYYMINGQPAPPDVQMLMARSELPPGQYWLNGQGYWGRVGNPEPIGNIYSGSYVSCYGVTAQPAPWQHGCREA